MTATATRTTTDLISLGDIYVSDFLAPGEAPRSEPWPLDVVMDGDGAVHLAEQPPAELMWGRYWYRSGTNQAMQLALWDVVESITARVELEPKDVWVDIACNDGSLLACVPEGVWKIGVDPATGDIHAEAAKRAEVVIQAPFDTRVGAAITHAYDRAKVITCIAMFYDLPDPADFLAGVHGLLADDGVFVVQVSYTPLMLEQLAFDNICHEHARYYTFATLADTFAAAGFRVVDAELNDVNGGSLRVTAMRDDADVTTFGSAPFRDVALFRVRALLDTEVAGCYNTVGRWDHFSDNVEALRGDVCRMIGDVVDAGKTVYGYGASTKGNTLLQYFGLDNSLVTAIAERQPGKVGLRTVGTDIPIVSEAEARDAFPDYMLMLPWHFVTEFTKRESAYLAAGGRFIVPCPKLTVVSA